MLCKSFIANIRVNEEKLGNNFLIKGFTKEMAFDGQTNYLF